MANERYIDADALIKKLQGMWLSIPTVYAGSCPSYGTYSLDTAVEQMINSKLVPNIQSALNDFKHQLTLAIEETATLKGTPCFLCKQRDGDELPENVYGCGKSPRAAA